MILLFWMCYWWNKASLGPRKRLFLNRVLMHNLTVYVFKLVISFVHNNCRLKWIDFLNANSNVELNMQRNAVKHSSRFINKTSHSMRNNTTINNSIPFRKLYEANKRDTWYFFPNTMMYSTCMHNVTFWSPIHKLWKWHWNANGSMCPHRRSACWESLSVHVSCFLFVFMEVIWLICYVFDCVRITLKRMNIWILFTFCIFCERFGLYMLFNFNLLAVCL